MSGVEVAVLDKLLGPLLAVLRSGPGWARRRYQSRRGKVLEVVDRGLFTGGVWRLATLSVLTSEDFEGLRTVHFTGVWDWLQAQKKAFPSGIRRDDLRLTARVDRGLVVEDAVALIEPGGRVAGPVAALVESPPACAREALLAGFDLTEGADHRAVVVHEDGGYVWTATPYFRKYDIALHDRESVALSVVSRTGGDIVRWRIQFAVRVEGKIRYFLYPSSDKSPLVTCDVDVAEQYWLAGVAGADGPPWLRAVGEWEFHGNVP